MHELHQHRRRVALTRDHTRIAAALLLSTCPAFAQRLPIAHEDFIYPLFQPLHLQAGGAGWLVPWQVSSLAGPNNDVVIFDSSITPPFPGAGPLDRYAGQAYEHGSATRAPSITGHSDVVQAGLFGRDGATIWLSARMQRYQGIGVHFGGIQFMRGGQEELLVGSPWDSNGWGIDDEGMAGSLPVVVPNTDDRNPAKLVVRVDHQMGRERVRMWIASPPSAPLPPTPSLDVLVHDFSWDELRLSSGGNECHFFWDEIVLEKGLDRPIVGTSYCGPAIPNTSSAPGRLLATGSATVADADLTLEAFQLPEGSFGFFIASQTQGFVQAAGGGQGTLCLGGAIGRFVGPGQVMTTGLGGGFELELDLLSLPSPSGLLAANPGETWNFQCWFRDSLGGSPTSNFTDGSQVSFL